MALHGTALVAWGIVGAARRLSERNVHGASGGRMSEGIWVNYRWREISEMALEGKLSCPERMYPNPAKDRLSTICGAVIHRGYPQ